MLRNGSFSFSTGRSPRAWRPTWSQEASSSFSLLSDDCEFLLGEEFPNRGFDPSVAQPHKSPTTTRRTCATHWLGIDASFRSTGPVRCRALVPPTMMEVGDRTPEGFGEEMGRREDEILQIGHFR